MHTNKKNIFMKKTFLKAALMFVATASAFTGFAQTNLGAACGCPPVASRPTVNLSTKATYVGLPNDYELNDCFTVLSCDTTYILDHKIYIPSGKTLIIQPGTVIKGAAAATPAEATSLVAEVGGKLIAQGSESCPIVFTSTSDDLTGSYGIKNRGKWGGVVLLGRATNNLKSPLNVGAGKLCVSDGVGYLEGYNSTNTRNNFGKLSGSFDDNDNSGTLSYVSIRYAGAIIALGNELNSLSLGSVGRGTKIDHVEIISGDDDGIELFGGTVNLKYCATLFGADDMLDYDLGWTGKVQFFLGAKTADTTTCPSADHGIEADADDNQSCYTPRSHPIIYNMTVVGSNIDYISNGDNSGRFAINAKEMTEGEIYNSVFSSFMAGFNMTKTVPAARTTNNGGTPNEAYNNWNAGTLIVKCNTFIGCKDSLAVDRAANGAGLSGADLTKFSVTDGNSSPSSVPGFNGAWVMDGTTNAVTTGFDAVPNPALATTCTPPNDGFFKNVSYRGAFGDGDNWLAKWSYVSILGAAAGDGFSSSGCPTDINGDGTTNNADFLDLLGKFNQTCQ